MAVSTSNKTTTITPTAWKWVLGAFLLFPIQPVSLLVSPVFFLTATGRFQRIELAPSGITSRNWWSVKKYHWEDIADFRVNEIKYSFFKAASMVKFTHNTKKDTLMGKASMALTGSTDSIPALGIKPKELVNLMTGYQRGEYPRDTVSRARAKPMEDAPALAGSPKPAALARNVPLQTRKPGYVTPKVIEAARLSRPRNRSDVDLFRKRRPTQTKKPSLPNPRTPLVQEGFKLFGRRPRTE